MKEKWKPVTVEPFTEIYEVSNIGRVRSLDKMGNHKVRGHKRIFRGRVLIQGMANNGYMSVDMRSAPYKKRLSVHRLVALAFVDNKYSKPQINHIDGDKANNHVDNLEWVTPSENQLHSRRIGLQKTVVGEDVFFSKLKVVDVLSIRERHASGESLISISKDYHVAYSNISAIITRRSWKHI